VIREVVVRTFDAPHEAELAAGYLRANGVQVRIDNDVLQGMNPMLSPIFGGVRVHVPAHRLKEALELLAETEVQAEPRNEAEPRSEVDADLVARRAAASALLGYTLLPIVGQLYSLWLLLGLRGKTLGPRGRRNRALALVLDLALVGLVGYVTLAS
jgi:hypothetical protein